MISKYDKSEKLSIEDVNKIRRYEIEKSFQNANLRQIEENRKKKENLKKMWVLEQEIEEKRLINERNLQENNMRKKLENMKKNEGNTDKKYEESLIIRELPEEVSQNMQNILAKELEKMRNSLIYQQNLLTEQVIGIKVH